MKALYSIIDDCTDQAERENLMKIRDKLCAIYEKAEAAEDFMSMCGNADVYEDYYSVLNGLYEILYITVEEKR